MKFCTKCGAPLKEGAFFCTSCGAPINNSASTGNQTPPSASVPANEAPANETSGNKKPAEAQPDLFQEHFYQEQANQQNSFQQDSFQQNPFQQNPFQQNTFEENAFQQQPYAAAQPARTGIFQIYGKALGVLARKPFRLWGISLLSGIISATLSVLFGLALGVGICIGILIDVGMIMVYLHGYRGEEVHTVQIFDAFQDGATIKRVLGGMAWMKMWILIWSLIPIVGPILAIIRSYQYRLTPYILVTEPEVSATQAIEISKERTQGWKAKMFGADILIWILIIVIGSLLMLLSMIPYLGYLFMIILFFFSLAVCLFSNLFAGLVQAAFYEEITAGLK